MINFFAFVLCSMFAIWYGIKGDIGLTLAECGLVLLNVPFVIKWVKSLLSDNK